jgi:hypothetical protein
MAAKIRNDERSMTLRRFSTVDYEDSGIEERIT